MKVVTLECGCVLLTDDECVHPVSLTWNNAPLGSGQVLVLKDCGEEGIRLVVPANTDNFQNTKITSVKQLGWSAVAHDLFAQARQ